MKGAIMFSAAMSAAVRSGIKTMTRRTAWRGSAGGGRLVTMWQGTRPGEVLWVREPFRGARGYDLAGLAPTKWGNKPIWYPADGEPPEDAWGFLSKRVHAPRTMPRDFSRTYITIEAVRIEPVQAITEADAMAEGIAQAASGDWLGPAGEERADPREAFALLWNSLHGADAWERNPEVVVLTFRATLANIDGRERV